MRQHDRPSCLSLTPSSALSAKQREPVDEAARYLLNHQKYMRCDEFLAAGLPIGTGVIEGACRHLVCDRMDGAARWSLKDAEAVRGPASD